MCEFCKKHGGGDKWYFNPKNYSKEMGEANKEILEKLADKTEFKKDIITGFGTIESLKNIPILNKLAINLGEKHL